MHTSRREFLELLLKSGAIASVAPYIPKVLYSFAPAPITGGYILPVDLASGLGFKVSEDMLNDALFDIHKMWAHSIGESYVNRFPTRNPSVSHSNKVWEQGARV